MPITFAFTASPTESPTISARSSSSNLSPTTDVDDSVPLSDLIFAGEQSRLRRRGAVHHPHSANQRHGRRTSSDSSSSQLSPSGYTVFCGGPPSKLPSHMQESENFTPFTPAILPWSKPSPRPPNVTHAGTSNGCGALIRTSAIPDTSINVFVSQSQRRVHDPLLLPIDRRYVNDAEIEFPEKLGSSTTCSCVRSAVACGICGNILGTRYLPCGQASRHEITHNSPISKPPIIDDISYYHPGNNSSTMEHSSGAEYNPDDEPDKSSLESVSGSSTPTIRPETITPPSYCIYSFLPSQVSSYPSYEFHEAPGRRGFAAFDRDRAILERSSMLRESRTFLQRGNYSDLPMLRYPETGPSDHISVDDNGDALPTLRHIRPFNFASFLSRASAPDETDASSTSSHPSSTIVSDPSSPILPPVTTDVSPHESMEDLTFSSSQVYGQSIYPPSHIYSRSTPQLSGDTEELNPPEAGPPASLPISPHYRPDYIVQSIRFTPWQDSLHLEVGNPSITSQDGSPDDGEDDDEVESLPDLISDVSWFSASLSERNSSGSQTQSTTTTTVGMPMETIVEMAEESPMSGEDRDRSLEHFFQIFLRLRRDGLWEQQNRSHSRPGISQSQWSSESELPSSNTEDGSSHASRSMEEGEEDKEWWQGLDLDANGDPRPRPPPRNLLNR